jgi:hypothetical protein
MMRMQRNGSSGRVATGRELGIRMVAVMLLLGRSCS